MRVRDANLSIKTIIPLITNPCSTLGQIEESIQKIFGQSGTLLNQPYFPSQASFTLKKLRYYDGAELDFVTGTGPPEQ